MKKIILGLFIAFSFSVHAQRQFQFYSELSLSGGVSLPYGKFSATNPSPTSDTANAMLGSVVTGVFEHRFFRHPAWSFSAAFGWQHNPANNDGVRKDYNISPNDFTQKAWNTFYLMPGMSWEIGKRFKVGLGINAGLVSSVGWGVELQEPTVGNVSTRLTRQPKPFFGFGYKPSIKLVYQIKPKIHLVAQADYLAASTSGIVKNTVNITNSQGTTTDTYNSTANTKITSLNVTLGLRYIFHRW